MHYWDTSALAKLYINEPDSAQFSAHLSPTGPLISSELVRWELFRILIRKECEGLLPLGSAQVIFGKFLADAVIGRVAMMPMLPIIEDRFRRLLVRLHGLTPPVFTRTLDGIHLATADVHNATELVATDINLRKCGAALGLRLFP